MADENLLNECPGLTDQIDESSVVSGAGLFDRSTQGKILVTGKDAPAFLHNLSTNDFKTLPLGAGCETYFCDHRAKVLAQAFAYHALQEGEHALWLDITAGGSEKLFRHLDKHLISEVVELSDVTNQYAQFHLGGPAAPAVLAKMMGEALPELAEFQHLVRSILDSEVQIRRHDILNLPGYDLVFRNERATEICQSLIAAGATPSNSATFEVMRIEAGSPIYGIDMGEDRFVMEVPRALRAVSYNKGCYLGQEPIVMSRDRAGFVNRAFLGVKVLEGPKLPVGTKLFRDELEVGLITSSTDSPALQVPLAIGYLRRGHQDVGLRLLAETPEGRRAVEVLGFPPVSRS